MSQGKQKVLAIGDTEVIAQVTSLSIEVCTLIKRKQSKVRLKIVQVSRSYQVTKTNKSPGHGDQARPRRYARLPQRHHVGGWLPLPGVHLAVE